MDVSALCDRSMLWALRGGSALRSGRVREERVAFCSHLTKRPSTGSDCSWLCDRSILCSCCMRLPAAEAYVLGLARGMSGLWRARREGSTYVVANGHRVQSIVAEV